MPSKKPVSPTGASEYTDVHERGYVVLPKKLVSLALAAEYAGVHPRTLRRQIAAGHLPAVRVGRNIKIDLNDLEAILKVRRLDCVVIGPYDLSASMGVMGRVRHPRVVKAIATVITKARRAGLYVGMGMGTEEELAVEAAAMGANWVQCGSDFGYMIKSAGELFGNIRKRALAESRRTTGAPKSPG